MAKYHQRRDDDGHIRTSGLSEARKTDKDQAIESIRGLAILLLVVYHSIGAEEQSNDVVRWMNTLIDPIIMPVFALLAGYVYAMRPLNWTGVPKFLYSKIRRLLVPFAIATVATVVLKGLLTGRLMWEDVWRPILFSYEHFWFLQSLFVVFVIAAVAEASGAFVSVGRWAFATLVIWSICEVMPGTDFFSLWGVNYLLPIFVVGYGAYRFPEVVLTKRALIVWAFIAAVALALFIMSRSEQIVIPDSRTALVPMLLGVATSILLVAGRPRLDSLVFLGIMSYCIYLYHGFGISLAVKLGGFAGIADSVHTVMIAKILMGLICPIVLALILNQVSWGRRLVLGQRQ